jgi:hypothetical protein
MFKCKINMYKNWGKSVVKIRALWPISFSHAKNLGSPLLQQQKMSSNWGSLYDRLGHTVSTKQTINWSEFLGLRYPTKHAEIWRFGLVRIIHARFVGYLNPTNLDQFIFCFVETVWPQFEDNFVLAIKGHRDFLHMKWI